MSALVGGQHDYFTVFEGAMALAESVVLLLLPADVHVFLEDDGSLFVMERSQLYSKKAYLAYHGSRQVNWKNWASVR